MNKAVITSKTMKVQYYAALVHFALFFSCAISAIRTPFDALYQAVWFPLFWIDLPATILLLFSYSLIPENINVVFDDIFRGTFSSWPFMSFWSFWWPLFIYGLFGTLWWFYLPALLKSIAKFFKKHSVLGNDERLR